MICPKQRASVYLLLTGLGNEPYFQIIQSCSIEITDRRSDHARGWEELHHSTAAATLNQPLVQVKREDFIAASVRKNANVCSRRGIRV